MLRETETVRPKLMVLGHARHGKDTVCEILAKHGYKFKSSSLFVCEKAVYPILKEKYGYNSVEECYTERIKHRKEWFDLIVQYNTPDLARLGKELFAEYDIYCGLRNVDEFHALKTSGLEFVTIWVDASARMPLESKDSCSIDISLADMVVRNNTTRVDLGRSVQVLMKNLEKTNANDNS